MLHAAATSSQNAVETSELRPQRLSIYAASTTVDLLCSGKAAVCSPQQQYAVSIYHRALTSVRSHSDLEAMMAVSEPEPASPSTSGSDDLLALLEAELNGASSQSGSGDDGNGCAECAYVRK